MTAPAAYEDLALLLDHSLVAPDLDDAHVVAGIQIARRYGVASVTVRPCDIDLAVRTLAGSSVRAGAVCGFPHGSENTAVKLFEARDLLRRGARQIEVVAGTSRLLSREFQHVQTELLQLVEMCHKEGALLGVILETAYLTDELKVVACACAERAEADFVCAGTGFAPRPATREDLDLIRRHLPEETGVKAIGAATLDQVLEFREAGCTRFGVTATAAILDEWKSRLAASAPPAPSV
jgi:deoxyribose-phosphate aldolase